MSKEIKATLKEARELLKQKEYKETVKKCKKVLKEDKSNYVALVLLGAAMQEIDEVRSQAPLAMKKAIDTQPNNPLAWQGLIAFYEREPDIETTWIELIPAYCKLLQINSDPTKFSHFLNNISIFSLKLKDHCVINEVIETLCKIIEISSEERVKLINAALASILMQYPNIQDRYNNLLQSTLAAVSKDLNIKNRQNYYRRYLKMLYKSQNFSLLLSEAALMHEQFNNDPYPLEWICRVYSEQNIRHSQCDGIEISQFYDALLTIDATSNYALFAKAVHLYQTNSFLEARDNLNQVVISGSQWLYVWILLAEVNAKLSCWENAENDATRALHFIKTNTENELINRIQLVLIEALAKGMNKRKWELVEQKFKKISEAPSNKLLVLLARAYILLGDSRGLALLDHLESEPETKVEATILRAIHLKNCKNLEEAADVLGSVLETSEAWLMLGKIYWDMFNYRHSLMAFLKGIHADPYNWECLIYLGHYYREHGNDLERSRRCYQKALVINPSSEQAGIGLSTAYRLLKNTEANMQLLQQVTTAHGSGPKWAWLQLGLQYLEQDYPTQAINALRTVIRADPIDNHSWECLADAYWARGAHISALKSYQRALDLSPGSFYPMMQLANIKLMLSQHIEAKQDFEHVLQQEPSYIPALKGLAETCLGLAKEYMQQRLLGRVRDNIQQATDYLTEVIIERSDLSCIWKLLGDSCYRMATLPKKYCTLSVVPDLVMSKSQGTRISIGRSDIFLLSSRCYCRALSLTADSALLWHDLAQCYLSQRKLNPIVNPKEIMQKSLAAAKQAVKLSPTNWFHWNILGVICMSKEVKNYALAQHCYVMAIDRESNNAITWTNLGTLYLYLGDPYRANEAFSRAQSADPAYLNSWIGQALIAEKMSRKEAMDLFRHATQLGYHKQATLGYTHWVLTTLLDPEAKKDPMYTYTIENMHAVTVATDAVTWYLEDVPDDLCALNAYGLLLERQKLYKPAAAEFLIALKSANTDTQKDALRVNLSRIQLHLGKYDKAVELCCGVRNANFNSHCQLALSLFKAEKYEESYEAYSAALHWLAGAGSDKAHVLCAMATIAYMFQGLDDVKTLLFQSIQIQPPTVAGLLAAAALGILHGDSNLTSLVVKELEPFWDDPDHRNDIVLLSAYSRVVQTDIQGAIRILSKAAHKYPSDVGPWVGLVRLLLETDVKTFGTCAQKALFLGRKTSTISIAQVACVASLSQLMTGDTEEGIRSVQKTLYAFPGVVESWANLIVGLLPRCSKKGSIPSAHWLTVLISIVRKKTQSSRTMAQWLSNNERKASLIADQLASD
ncbi:tetratricopeptide repeat protein 37 [Cephus cinctus]|uniref:Tetratricopeptide repeat protein 37 n=1 Tax=Cephus cinctus TaxID=211228 RepID=A0AAJ7BQX1_CEPCN|nr:tetratricopeptide repeat protein 37 [Cephus cinctus]